MSTGTWNDQCQRTSPKFLRASDGSRGRFEVVQSGSAGDLGFWTGVHQAEMSIEGRDGLVPMVLRTTEIFRLEKGALKLVHRHADFLKQHA